MELSYGYDFKMLCIQQNIGDIINGSLTITQSEFDKINEIHPIIEIDRGGLVLGKSHKEGGIHMLIYNANNKRYDYVGEMEGMEYITGDLFTTQIKDFYLKLNSEYSNDDNYIPNEDFNIPESCRVYDLKQYELPIIFFRNENRCIINRHATERLIDELVESEKLYN